MSRYSPTVAPYEGPDLGQTLVQAFMEHRQARRQKVLEAREDQQFAQAQEERGLRMAILQNQARGSGVERASDVVDRLTADAPAPQLTGVQRSAPTAAVRDASGARLPDLLARERDRFSSTPDTAQVAPAPRASAVLAAATPMAAGPVGVPSEAMTGESPTPQVQPRPSLPRRAQASDYRVINGDYVVDTTRDPESVERRRQQQTAEWLRAHGVDVPEGVEGLDVTPFVQTAVQQGQKEAERSRSIEALTRAYVSHGMSEAQARALAEVGASGLQLQPYKAITRAEQMQDVRDEGKIKAEFRPDADTNVNWQTAQTEDGFVQVNPRTGQVRPITSPSGEQMQPRKNTPAWVPKAVAANQRQISTIDNALSLLDQYPAGVSGIRGRSDWLDQRVDPRGVALRAAISDVGSLEIRDRSGAAVTAAEFPRLAPFIPSARDTPDAVRTKLMRMRQIVAEENELIQQGAITQPMPAGGAEYSVDNPFTTR